MDKQTGKSPLLGIYSDFLSRTHASEISGDLSFLNGRFSASDVSSWKMEARPTFEQLTYPPTYPQPVPKILWEKQYDGLTISLLQWQLPFGRTTEAFYLRPLGVQEKLPGILALHDHGNNKFHGKSKIVQTDSQTHQSILSYQEDYYGGRPWANELAKRGYVVLVHDIFPFESRRLLFSDVPGRVIDQMLSHPEQVHEPQPGDTDASHSSRILETMGDTFDTIQHIDRYNAFARELESTIAKAIFTAGYTWPGLTLAEDRTALSVLESLPGVDPMRLGCCGLSLGGLRSDYLAGSTEAIQCSATIGFMTTWRDLIQKTAVDHTWMLYIPYLSQHVEFADILAMHAPKPALVINATDDPLFSFDEVKRGQRILEKTYAKMGFPDNFTMTHYPGGHRFDVPMQEQVFTYFDKFL